jgi:hypothetical protein
MESDQQYFWRRSQEQSAAADRASDVRARVAHLELAARYAQLAAAISEAEERLGVRKAGTPLRLVQPEAPRAQAEPERGGNSQMGWARP